MSRPLNFRQIEAFRAVMLSGTTIAAAATLGTTQRGEISTGCALLVVAPNKLKPP
jgi:DNA-binding transcriptional LysR family regulator